MLFGFGRQNPRKPLLNTAAKSAVLQFVMNLPRSVAVFRDPEQELKDRKEDVGRLKGQVKRCIRMIYKVKKHLEKLEKREARKVDGAVDGEGAGREDEDFASSRPGYDWDGDATVAEVQRSQSAPSQGIDAEARHLGDQTRGDVSGRFNTGEAPRCSIPHHLNPGAQPFIPPAPALYQGESVALLGVHYLTTEVEHSVADPSQSLYSDGVNVEAPPFGRAPPVPPPFLAPPLSRVEPIWKYMPGQVPVVAMPHAAMIHQP